MYWCFNMSKMTRQIEWQRLQTQARATCRMQDTWEHEDIPALYHGRGVRGGTYYACRSCFKQWQAAQQVETLTVQAQQPRDMRPRLVKP